MSVFFDTNILLYADDDDAPSKQAVARQLLAAAIGTGDGVISTQVVQEYYANALRKLGFAPARARILLDQYLTLNVVEIRLDQILGAIDLHRLHQLSFWDALVVRCASDAGCDRLLSEDLQHGRVFEGVRVENPFAKK